MTSLYIVDGKLLIKNNSLATSEDCCCGENICCYCIQSWGYVYFVNGAANCGLGCGDQKPWAGISFAPGHICYCNYKNNDTNANIRLRCDHLLYEPEPPNSTLIYKDCISTFACRASDYAENGDDPFPEAINGNTDSGYANSSPWGKADVQRAACRKTMIVNGQSTKITREECEKCTDPPTTTTDLFNDLCGIFHENQINKRCIFPEWDNQCFEDIP